MRIKRSNLTLLVILLGLIVAIFVGFNLWNTQVMSNLGKLSQFSLYLIIIFSFFAGAVSFFSPCGLALFPAFISYNMAIMTNNSTPQNSKSQIIKIGLFSALGIITFYILLGILFSLLGSIIAPYIQVFQYFIAFLFIVFGIMLMKKSTFTSSIFGKFKDNMHSRAMKQSGYKGFYLFGFAYGLDIIGCLFPLISALILIPIATGNLTTGILAFLSYSIALAVMMSIFAYLIAFSKKTLVSEVLKSTEKLKIWMGMGLIIGGIALLSYYLFFGMAVG